MPGPINPASAPEGARGGQYVTVPAFASPGQSLPSHSRTAEGSTVVYSPKGWRWEEAGDEYSKSVSKLTAATMESAVRRIRSSFGTVLYIRGTSDTEPPFRGETLGDTVRVQDAQTLDIVAEWKWNGSSWERMRVTSEQISNLDVGKLTVGAANIAELTARKIAADVGRFLEITTDQLTVTGNASFVNATAHHVWTKIITAGQGEFEKIRAGMLEANSVSASNIQAGAVDGQVITGATLQTERADNRGLKLTSDGLRVYDPLGRSVLDVNAHTGAISISGHLSRRDSWSMVWFNDVISTRTGRDVGTDGSKWGCGLAFNSLEDNWGDGVIALLKDRSGDPSIRMQAPYTGLGDAVPYITVGTSYVTMYTPSGDTLFEFKSGGVRLRAQDIYWWADGGGFSYGTTSDNKPRLYVGPNTVHIRPMGESLPRFWGDRNSTTMQYTGKHQVWINGSGVNITGGKKFSMRVPVLTAERGGLWLEHSCTESPYDGIEYWENVTLDGDGRYRWTLPDYVPRIASKKAPWVVFANEGARGVLDRSNPEEWHVDVTGTPGAVVAVLVKGARQVDQDVDEHGEPIMRDYARESPWHIGAPTPPAYAEGGVPEDDMALGGGMYGPVTKPEGI
nr:MAG TPA: hypothetical protein [Caudoviricetes sp.]